MSILNKSILNKFIESNRTLLSDSNENFFDLLKEFIPVNVHRFKSGTESFDWKIPKKWKVNRGVIKNSKGKTIIDSSDNILHLINYSNSFKGKLSLNELKNYLHYDEDLPNAIPYRTTYYSDNWGFCLSYNDFISMTDDYYYVDIDTEFVDGELLIGEAVIKGELDREIILSSYYCHPNQANDGLSGVFLLSELYDKMKNLNLKYTYKFFFWPETIGALTSLSQRLIIPENVEYSMVSTTVGYGNTINYKKTYLENHSIDNIIEDLEEDINITKYNPTGSDERQFSSNGIRIPSGVLTLESYENYKEYHTSEDNLDLISINNIKKMTNLYLKILLKYEKYDKYKLSTHGGEPFLTKYNLYRTIGVPGHSDDDVIRNWVIHYSDGTKNKKDISKLIGCEESIIEEFTDEFKIKGLLI